MRVLLACEFYYPSRGGVQEVMRQVAERLAGRGHQVSVATTFLPGRTSNEHNGVTILEHHVHGNVVNGLAGDVGKYRDLVMNGDHDVLMVKAAQQWTFDALIPVIDQIKKPKVFIPCGFSALHEPTYKAYYENMPRLLSKFDHLIFYASSYRDVNMAREHGLENFSIVPNGASEVEFGASRDPAFRHDHGIDPDAFVVLTVGTFTGEKGHRELAQAFLAAPLPHANSFLLLNGNHAPRHRPLRVRSLVGRARRYARRVRDAMYRRPPRPTGIMQPLRAIVDQINELSPAKRAAIMNLPRDELVQAYFASDLFVFASNIEYSPLVLYEAAAAGLPFLTVPVGNSAEIASWTGGGVVCPAITDERGYTRVDPVVLGEHMSRLAADAPLLWRLGEAGHEAWSREFTWDKITDRYEAILTAAVNSARP